MSLFYDVTPEKPDDPIPPEIGVTERQLIALLHDHVHMGLWRSELKTGLLFFSQQACRIFGLPQTPGPVNQAEVNRRLHPEDAPAVYSVVETVASEKGSFEIVIRVSEGGADYKTVRFVGRYREAADGGGEIIGICHEIPTDGA